MDEERGKREREFIIVSWGFIIFNQLPCRIIRFTNLIQMIRTFKIAEFGLSVVSFLSFGIMDHWKWNKSTNIVSDKLVKRLLRSPFLSENTVKLDIVDSGRYVISSYIEKAKEYFLISSKRQVVIPHLIYSLCIKSQYCVFHKCNKEDENRIHLISLV